MALSWILDMKIYEGDDLCIIDTRDGGEVIGYGGSGAIFERLLIVSHCGVVFQSLRSFLSNLRVLEVLYLSWSFIASTSSPSTASSLSFLLYT